MEIYTRVCDECMKIGLVTLATGRYYPDAKVYDNYPETALIKTVDACNLHMWIAKNAGYVTKFHE